jgi:hypothetical protein
MLPTAAHLKASPFASCSQEGRTNDSPQFRDMLVTLSSTSRNFFLMSHRDGANWPKHIHQPWKNPCPHLLARETSETF